MYLKLALRNAKRSIFDYLLYIISMTMLISIICISNCLASLGNMQFGFQTASLPLLIAVIMVFLVGYLNTFMVKQRTKEFAAYLLLGMEKSKLSLLFLVEICAIGTLCFFIGTLFGVLIYYVCSDVLLQLGAHQNTFQIISKSVLQTLWYFCIVEILSVFRMKQKMYNLEISQLMYEKRHNEPLNADKKSFWCRLFVINLFLFLILLCATAFGSDEVGFITLPIISIPLLCLIFSFYKWMYTLLAAIRISKAIGLYQNNRLYHISEITATSKTASNLNTIFSICFIFSVTSFSFGTALLNENFHFFSKAEQNWMGFLQISICIVFLVIYFSISSLHQIIGIRRQAKNIQLLSYIGENQDELKSMLRTQVLTNLFIPTAMAFFLIFISAPFINYKMNLILPETMLNFLAYSIIEFTFCFFLLYVLYFCIIQLMSSRYIKVKNR